MKLKFTIIFSSIILLFSNSVFACWCSILATTTYQYQISDFVGVVKIIKNYKNDPVNNQHYIADIEILNLYKGKPIKQLYILGNNGGEGYNSCGTFIEEGETRLIFGKTLVENKISTDVCSSHHKPNRDYYKREFIEEKLNVLARFAKNHKIKIVNDAAISTAGFKKVQTANTNKNFSIVGIKVSANGTIKKIYHLTDDEKQVKKACEEYIKSTFKGKQLEMLRKHNDGSFTVFLEFNSYKS